MEKSEDKREMKLGTLNLENRYILAPMLNVSTSPYRRFCRKFQKIGLVSVPMQYTKKIEKNPKSIERELIKIEEERPISIQLIGSDLKAQKEAIIILESYDFDVLDINAGCPSQRAVKAKEGGYLMKNLDHIKILIENAVKYSSKPVSLKIRTGFEKPINIEEMANIINNSGIEFLIIHARTVRSKFYDDSIDLDTVKSLKEKSLIPVVGNGDMKDALSAKHFIDYTNVDALMIGRESTGNPEIFKQIHEYLTSGKEIPFKNNVDKMKKYIQLFEECINEYLTGFSHPQGNKEIKFIELKRNAIWLTKNIENSAKYRRNLSTTKNIKEIKSILEEIQ